MSLTAETLREQFYYSRELGEFFRRREHQGNPPWARCGYTVTKGYRQMRVGGVAYRVHRLAWLYVTGEWPEQQIDHENRIKGDNRWDNLRDVTQRKNKLNTPMYKNNTSGFRGVSRYGARWMAQITEHGKRRHIGYFATPEEASAAYEKVRGE